MTFMAFQKPCQEKFGRNSSNQLKIASIHNLSNSLFTLHPTPDTIVCGTISTVK
jgi:hypothetical protein